jgi:uncharacterized membrane protein (DUF373 family)
MELKDEPLRIRTLFAGLTFYERFEHAVVLVLTMLIVAIVASATVHLAIAVLALLISDQMDPANQQVFQVVFGMIFTVIIALEFKHSLLVVLAGQESIVRARSIVLIALLAVTRKFIIIDLRESAPGELFALAAAILALGLVYWLVRDQDRRIATPKEEAPEQKRDEGLP